MRVETDPFQPTFDELKFVAHPAEKPVQGYEKEGVGGMFWKPISLCTGFPLSLYLMSQGGHIVHKADVFEPAFRYTLSNSIVRWPVSAILTKKYDVPENSA